MASKKGDGDPNQPAFEFLPPPVQALRAVHVTLNELARKRGIQFYPNFEFRVPLSFREYFVSNCQAAKPPKT